MQTRKESRGPIDRPKFQQFTHKPRRLSGQADSRCQVRLMTRFGKAIVHITVNLISNGGHIAFVWHAVRCHHMRHAILKTGFAINANWLEGDGLESILSQDFVHCFSARQLIDEFIQVADFAHG